MYFEFGHKNKGSSHLKKIGYPTQNHLRGVTNIVNKIIFNAKIFNKYCNSLFITSFIYVYP